jgi:hypothetical protein
MALSQQSIWSFSNVASGRVRSWLSLLLLGVACVLPTVQAATLSVGPTKRFKSPCAAIRVAQRGDVIEVEGGAVYSGDVCEVVRSNLTIRGVHGRPHIEAAGKDVNGKGIWDVLGNRLTVENIEFSGAKVGDKNGSAIRLEAPDLTVRHCYFHDNDDGILTSSPRGGAIVIEYSEFARNGRGDGFSHNLYISGPGSLTFRYNYSHHANVGHLLKSRAEVNIIAFNRFSDEETGNSSYSIDLPYGGTAWVYGNVIEQGPLSENPGMLAFAMEGRRHGEARNNLHVLYNTFVNRAMTAMFIVTPADLGPPAEILNNVFAGAGVISNQSGVIAHGNVTGTETMFRNAAAYDFSPLANSPAVGAAESVPADLPASVMFDSAYVHPVCWQARKSMADAGAYERRSDEKPDAINCGGFDLAGTTRK